MPLLIEQQIRWFKVSVNNILTSQVVENADHLAYVKSSSFQTVESLFNVNRVIIPTIVLKKIAKILVYRIIHDDIDVLNICKRALKVDNPWVR